ncbi:hypothetical protein IQ07DRAFT_187009 [Pyrenochaeta sp. DS3sAY3a]|nr:hypothetical protein IQ07DRAFT_187009 [Pyrenochaeta sp. DS3sAY3a]
MHRTGAPQFQGFLPIRIVDVQVLLGSDTASVSAPYQLQNLRIVPLTLSQSRFCTKPSNHRYEKGISMINLRSIIIVLQQPVRAIAYQGRFPNQPPRPTNQSDHCQTAIVITNVWNISPQIYEIEKSWNEDVVLSRSHFQAAGRGGDSAR